jgi:excisionase family DNA binding protein
MGADEQTSVMADFFEGVMQLAADAKERLSCRQTVRGRSYALSMAVDCGLKPQMAYSVVQTSRYTGVPVSTLYREHDEGRIEFVKPKDKRRGFLVRVEEVDRWMGENAE